jgi:hypothetical protein
MRFVKLSIAFLSTTPALAYAQEPMPPPPQPVDTDAGPAEETRAEEFASRGTLEVGGAIGAIITENTSTFTASPTVGYFVADGIEVSGIFQIAYTRIEDAFGNDDSQTVGSLIVEPSYHYPLGPDVLVNGGVGIGGGYNGDDINFQIIPSVGLDVLTSRHTVVTPTLRMPIVIADAGDLESGVDTDIGLALDVGISATW